MRMFLSLRSHVVAQMCLHGRIWDMGMCVCACLNDSECNIEHMYNQNILLSAVDTLPRAWSECVCCS